MTEIERRRVVETIEALSRQVNALIESCYYRTKDGGVHWKQGRSFGTSVADDTDPKAFEEAIAAIRRNAGIDEITLEVDTDFREALDALRELVDGQNGPPLLGARHEKAWRDAMDKAESVLKKHGA